MAEHTLPQELILNRDKLFTPRFWKALITQLDIKHRLSIAYYPQTDRQTKYIK